MKIFLYIFRCFNLWRIPILSEFIAKLRVVVGSFAVGLSILASSYSLCAMEPSPPTLDSKIGYLTASEEFFLPSPLKKVFILPQQSLKIVQEDDKSLRLLADFTEFSVLCIIPKLPKFVSLIERSGDGKSIFFRGAIEAETIPIFLKKGEELPIKKMGDDGFIVFVKRGETIFTVKIAVAMNGLKFDRESAFAKFAETKKKNGLEYLDGKWLPIADVKKVLEARQAEMRKSLERRKNVINAATLGFVVLKDGSVLHGRITGQDDNGIIFEGERGSRFVRFDDNADISFEDIVGTGRIFLSAKLLEGNSTPDFFNAGKMRRNSDEALAQLEKISQKTSLNIQNQKMEFAKIARNKITVIDEFLRKNDFALYKYKIFPVEVLRYHLKEGNIVLENSIWIKPEQLCKKCSGKGILICSNCAGTGKFKEKCSNCDNGRVKCHICDGSGRKSCSRCNGLGLFSKRCSRCAGTGFISRFVPYRWTNDIEVSNGNLIIRSNGYPYCYYETFRLCPDCIGTGLIQSKCSSCGGSGMLSCPITEKCKQCDGVGYFLRVCKECGGLGKIKCFDCDGKGFTGEEQKMPVAYEQIWPGGNKRVPAIP